MRGNKFPAITTPAMTASRISGSGLVIADGPTSACPTNRNSTQKIMKTFHSSGTPIGMADRIPRWKQIMTTAAMVVGQPPCEKNSTSGTSPSMAVLTWASARESRPGRRSSGKCSKKARLRARGRTTGLLDIIVEMTNGKCLVSLEVAAPSQITRQAIFAATITLGPLNRKAATNGAYTSPRAARKMTLSRSPLSASNISTAQDCQVGSRPISVPSSAMGPVPSESNATRSTASSAP